MEYTLKIDRCVCVCVKFKILFFFGSEIAHDSDNTNWLFYILVE